MHRRPAILLIGSLALAGMSTTGASPGLAQTSAPPEGLVAQGGVITYSYGIPDQDHHIFTVRPDGSRRAQLVPYPEGWSAWSPDGSRLLVPYDLPDGRIVAATVLADGTDLDVVPLPSDGSMNLGPAAWAPDGGRIALEGWGVTDGSLNGLFTATRQGEDLTRLTRVDVPGTHDIALSYSPDGRSILFLRLPEDADRGQLYVVSVDGKTLTRLSADGQGVWFSGFGPAATWSADSGRIAFAAFDGSSGSQSAAYTVAVDGTGLTRIVDPASYITGARFSPDGTWVLYDRRVSNGHHHMFLVRPDGTGTTQISDESTTGTGDCCGAWSPDGRSIVFQAGDSASAQLYTMAVDGTGVQLLTDDPGEYEFYTWGPDASTAP